MARAFVTKHLRHNRNGTISYRRRIPEQVQKFTGKKEFVKLLGKSEAEALRRYASVDAEFERLIRTGTVANDNNDRVSAKQDATTALMDLGVDPYAGPKDEDDYFARDVYVDRLLRKYPKDPQTGHPEGVSVHDEALVTGLLSGIDAFEAEPTITYAIDFYSEEKKQTDPYKRKKQVQRLERLKQELLSVTGGDLKVSDVKRSHARALRDLWLTRVSPETAHRYNNDIKAIINFAIRELELECSNPFEKLDFPKSATKAIDKVQPLPRQIILGMYEDLRQSPVLLDVWTILHHTGAQPGEVLGLLREEVVLDAKVPHLLIQENVVRSLKTAARVRRVPLVGSALRTAERIAAQTLPGQPMFPRYAPTHKHDAFSATVMKRLRRLTTSEHHVVYSLRHNMKDALRRSEAGHRVELALLGHSESTAPEAQYGSGVSLEDMQAALNRIEFDVPR